METETNRVAEDAMPLCPGCFHVLENDPDFCPKCNAPVGMITLIDPLREAKAYAYLYRRGVEFPNTRLILFGMLAMFGTYLVSGVFFLPYATTSSPDHLPWEWIGLAAIGLAYATFGGVGLYKTIHNRIKPSFDEAANNERE